MKEGGWTKIGDIIVGVIMIALGIPIFCAGAIAGWAIFTTQVTGVDGVLLSCSGAILLVFGLLLIGVGQVPISACLVAWRKRNDCDNH